MSVKLNCLLLQKKTNYNTLLFDAHLLRAQAWIVVKGNMRILAQAQREGLFATPPVEQGLQVGVVVDKDGLLLVGVVAVDGAQRA